MAKNETVRIVPSNLQADRDVFAALKAIPGYNPLQPDFSVKSIAEAQTTMVDLRDVEAQKEVELKTARDNATAAEWAFHNKVLGAKDQVKAQYGDNSNEYQAIGRTKSSERKSPTRQSATPPPVPALAGTPA